MSTEADALQAELDKQSIAVSRSELRAALTAALTPELLKLQAELDSERALLKLSLSLLKRCREEGMPYYLRREIDEAITSGANYL